MRPRTLADELRAWPEERLTGLLLRRPDLATPAPQDSSQLASRAGSRGSVLRALDGLDRLSLAVLDALVVLGARASRADLTRVVHADPAAVDEALDAVRGLALVWGPDDDLRVVGSVVDTLGTTVSGLGPPVEQLLGGVGPERVAALLRTLGETTSGDRADDVRRVATLLADPARVTALAAECDAAARAMLERLDAHHAGGSSDAARHPVDADEARTPAEQLVARGLLMARDRRHLVVPREVGLALRGGRTTREAMSGPPPLATAPRSQSLVDRASAGAAHELVHRVELLLDRWGEEPPGVLRQGGLAIRDLRAAAELVHADEPTAALVVETAAAAGLLAEGATVELDAAWLPTDELDHWREQPLAVRWARLAAAWLDSARLVGLVGARDRGRTVNALAPDLDRPWVAEVRRGALAALTELPPGEVLATGQGPASLAARLRWLRPRDPGLQGDAVHWALREGAVIGVVGLGGLPEHGRVLLDEGAEPAATALGPLMPAPVDHVLLQGDLTAVAPGPLEQALARDLATIAHVESRGGATVYRFTEASVRHALDVGWSAEEVVETITSAARTAMPQALEYLIRDVARTHGTVRLGAAAAFLRSDDETALAALLHDPRAADLQLRRLAPTVLVSQVPAEELLPRVRALGLSAVVEGAEGVVHLGRREAHRARTPRRPTTPRLAARATAHAVATAKAVRAGDQARERADHRGTAGREQSPAEVLAVLREAAEAGTPVSLGYLDGDGSRQERVVEPRRVDGGQLWAYDLRSAEVRTFRLHRISSARVT